MDWVFFIGLALLITSLALAWWLLIQRQAGPKNTTINPLDTLAAWPPKATRVLHSTECRAYAALKTGLPECMILAQVPLSRFIKIPSRNTYSEWLKRVGFLSVDLLVCDIHSEILSAVDVRRPERLQSERSKKRHERLDRTLKAANIAVQVWYEDAIPEPHVARQWILERVQNKILPDQALVEIQNTPQSESESDGPSSTWFNNLDSGAMPLNPIPVVKPTRHTGNKAPTTLTRPVQIHGH
jgi:hypothetical protein